MAGTSISRRQVGRDQDHRRFPLPAPSFDRGKEILALRGDRRASSPLRGPAAAGPYRGVLFEAARPILLNGIEEVVSRPDLGDRAIFLTLASIGEAQRRPESELWREFEIARPRILGALLDAMVHGLGSLGRVHLNQLPRMADFAVWVTACEGALWPAGTFARAYAANRRAAIDNIIEADPVASRIRAMMANRTIWTGSASDLLLLCSEGAREGNSSGSSSAKNPRALAGRLRRAQTFLRTLGIEITFSREGRTGSRMIRVSTRTEDCVSSVSLIRTARGNGSRGDQPGAE
jgi:hypothetical protein